MDFDTVFYNTTSAAPIIVPWDGDRSVSPFTVRIFTNGAPLPDSTPGSEILKVFNHPVGADHVTAHVNGNLVRWIPIFSDTFLPDPEPVYYLQVSDSIGYYDLSCTFLLMSQYVYNHTHINVSPTTPSSAPGMTTSATPRRSTDTTSSSPATGVTINISSKDSTPAAPHLSPGAIAGITIGGIVFVVLPIPLGILLFRKFKKQKTNQADAQQEQETNDADGQQEPGSQAEQQPLWQRLLYRRFEMDGTARPPEMPTPDETANRSELMGDVPSPVEPRRSANRPNFEMDGGALSLSYTTTGQR